MLDILCRLTHPLTHIDYALLLIVPKGLMLMQLSCLETCILRGLEDEQEIKSGVSCEWVMKVTPPPMLKLVIERNHN
jgi:hypothetical protein